jgi:hypothetical protein
MQGVMLYGLDDSAEDVSPGYHPVIEQNLRIAIDGPADVTAASHDLADQTTTPLLISTPLTSSPKSVKSVPLTPECSGTSPIFAQTPTGSEDLNALLSPSSPNPEQEKLALRRNMKWFDDSKVSTPSSHVVVEHADQRRTCTRRLSIFAGCMGVSALAAAMYVIGWFTRP